jgi:hypothetical protein
VQEPACKEEMAHVSVANIFTAGFILIFFTSVTIKTTNHLKIGVEKTHETWLTINIPQTVNNVQHNHSVIN